tara:strand:- start:576 stop:1406 length:831 start_codon:yes stop_codon:yes gene_type:complete
MRNILIIVLCVFISSFFIVEKKNKNKKSLPYFLKFEMFKIDLEKKHNFFQFYVDAIFKSHDLNKSLNENDQKIEKSKPIIFEPTLIEIEEVKIEEVKIEEDLQESFFRESKKSIDFQNLSEQKSPPALDKQINIIEEEVKFVEIEDSKLDIVENEIATKDLTDIEPAEIIDEKQVDTKDDDISEEIEPKEILTDEEETSKPKNAAIVNPQKTLNEAIYYYTFEGNNTPELKKGLNEELLECLLNRELDFNDLLNIFNENKGKTISKKALKTYLKNK